MYVAASRGGTFYKKLGLYLRFHASFIHATLIGVMLNFWKVGVAPTTPLYTKTPPLAASNRLRLSIKCHVAGSQYTAARVTSVISWQVDCALVPPPSPANLGQPSSVAHTLRMQPELQRPNQPSYRPPKSSRSVFFSRILVHRRETFIAESRKSSGTYLN